MRGALVAAGLVMRAAPVLAGPMPGMVLVASDAAPVFRPAPASLPKGIRMSILAGDPAKPGPFTLRLRIPANTVIAPHTHATAETLTLLSGMLYHEVGATLDKARGDKITTGGFVLLPSDMPHSLWTVGKVTEIQVNGTGPFGLHYINPADDPSGRN